jgi:hypothetical protein
MEIQGGKRVIGGGKRKFPPPMTLDIIEILSLKRDLNMITVLLAKHALANIDGVWIEEVSLFFSQFVLIFLKRQFVLIKWLIT